MPDDPTYCFCPVAEADGEPPQIRILVEGFAFAIPTALVALDRADGLAVCDSVSTGRSASTASAWTALAARFLRAGAGEPPSHTLH